MRTLEFAPLSAVVLFAFVASPAPAQGDREAASWTSIMNSHDPEDFRDFLQAFPRGEFANDARERYRRDGARQAFTTRAAH